MHYQPSTLFRFYRMICSQLFSNILAIKFGYVVIDDYLCMRIRDVAQLVAHTSGGREVASSSLVIPTIQSKGKLTAFLFSFESNQKKL